MLPAAAPVHVAKGRYASIRALRTLPSHATMPYGPSRHLLPPRRFAVEYQKPAGYDTR